MTGEKLKVGLDLTPLHSDLRTGSAGRVAQAYFEWFTANSGFEVVPYSRGDFPRTDGDGSEEWKNKLWDRWRIAWEFRGADLDVLQIVDPRRVPPFSNSPVVTLVHDLIPYLYRERYQADLFDRYLFWRMKRQIVNSDFIVTPSRSTAKDLQMSFGLQKEKVKPVYHGIDQRRFYPRSEEKVEEVCNQLDISAPYFLVVADLSQYDPIKNLEEIIENWDYRILSEIQLVFAGKKGEYSQRLEELWEGKKNNLVFTGYIDDEQLAGLYSGAQLLLFPSRYEGFGFSVLEAMACGTKPVVREVGALKEISGSPAIKLDDNEYPDQLMDVLTDALGDFRIDEDCVKHAEKFNWQKTVDKLEKIYEEASALST
ncbi:MAG: glycosyltransferase family 4 protein [bacterium]